MRAGSARAARGSRCARTGHDHGTAVIAAWRRYRALPPSDRRLLREAATLLILVRCGLVILPFPVMRRLLHGYASQDVDPHGMRAPQERRTTERDVPARVAWAVGALSRRAPGPTTCLAQALVADALIRRRGVRSALRIGVKRSADAPGPLQAHAWVECGDQIVVGRLDDLSEYSVLSSAERP